MHVGKLDEVTKKEFFGVSTFEKEPAKGTSGRKAFSLGGIRRGKMRISCTFSRNQKQHWCDRPEWRCREADRMRSNG